MKSVYNVQNGEWNISWPERVSRHDLVYDNPPLDPTQGLPLGNGEIGALLWCESTKIVIAVNKSDLWDDSPNDRFGNWKHDEEERSTCLRHACRINIDFTLPVFDPFYLESFSARLSIADGCFHLSSESVFGKVLLNGFIDWHSGAFVVDVVTDLNEEVDVCTTLERFGSRTFSHWYALVRRDPGVGLQGTKSAVSDTTLYITHPLTSGEFTVACSVDSERPLKQSVLHSRAAQTIVHAFGVTSFSLRTVVTSPMESGSVTAADTALASTRKLENADLINAHKAAWKEFWMRSLVECGNDYHDNLWHLSMFYLACSQRGKYPGRFINGLWTWNRDVQNWNFYFHWNQQQLYWPLNAAGHHDLVESYLDYRFNSLGYAQKDAKDLFGVDGAFVSDVCDRLGRNSECEDENHTPVAQIAMEFWRQYLYTGDIDFLRTKAWPYIRSAAIFFESRFVLLDDGFYHAKDGTGYEGWIVLKDSITELVCGEVLFKAACDVVEILGIDEPQLNTWKEIASRIVSLPVSDEHTGGGLIPAGPYKGEPAECDWSLAAGWGIEKQKIVHSCFPEDLEELKDGVFEVIQKSQIADKCVYPRVRDLKCYDGIFPCSEYSAVFPCGVLGVKDRDSELFKAARNIARTFTPSLMGWDVIPIVMARLGLARETWDAIERMPADWQFYCNGFTHYGPKDVQKAESSLPFKQFKVIDADRFNEECQGKFLSPAWPFRHVGLEAMGVFACAVNEALMQSWDGVIRVAPAMPAGRNARFTLHTVGGFVVSCEIENGTALWIDIRSLRGQQLSVEIPWMECSVYRNLGYDCGSDSNILTCLTKVNERILLLPKGVELDDWETIQEVCESNSAPKYDSSGLASLGLQQAF